MDQGEYGQQVNGPGVQQKGVEAPATKLEVGQATGLQTGVGNVAKEPLRGGGQREVQGPESGKGPRMNGQEWYQGCNLHHLSHSIWLWRVSDLGVHLAPQMYLYSST